MPKSCSTWTRLWWNNLKVLIVPPFAFGSAALGQLYNHFSLSKAASL